MNQVLSACDDSFFGATVILIISVVVISLPFSSNAFVFSFCVIAFEPVRLLFSLTVVFRCLCCNNESSAVLDLIFIVSYLVVLVVFIFRSISFCLIQLVALFCLQVHVSTQGHLDDSVNIYSHLLAQFVGTRFQDLLAQVFGLLC